jgi:hypothetical protein
MNNGRTDAFRRFAIQAAVLAWGATAAFWVLYILDHYWLSRDAAGGFANAFSRYFSFTPDSNVVATLSGIIVAVFGIVITIVSIIVQLTADRYTGVARMFLRDRVNIDVAAYYVVASVISVWLSAAIQDGYVPRATLLAMLCMTTGGLVIMMPYFGYVFWFLDPQNLIRHIRKDAIEHASNGVAEHDEAKCFAEQAETLFALEELTDIANNSISGKDKIIASAAVDALRDFAIEYLKLKPQASDAWFSIGPEIRLNPDFVAMDAESIGDLEARHTWIEWKVMRQCLSIYTEALASMRDINYVIAIDTRYIGEAAAKANDPELMRLVFRYMNSYLRMTLNARDVRTAYNVLNQYRKLGEAMLAAGRHQEAVEAVRHMKYYGLIGFEMELNFVTETVAYDLSALAQNANELGSPAEREILNEFLELDRSPFMRDEVLLGVRKAQVKLALHYLESDQVDRARAIADDMRGEPSERLQRIHRQLAAVESKDFWEIIDRGRNFEYTPPNLRAHLPTFFSWLRAQEGAVAPD